MLFDGRPGLKLFDPGITTGPTLNIPAAILIRLFGNLPWVPGFVTATVSILLLLVIAIILSKSVGRVRSAVYLCVLIFLLYSLTAGLHFEEWYSLIGDMPAALLSIAAVAILVMHPDRRSVIAICGLVSGLAMMTKLLAFLSFAPICVWLVWRVVSTRTARCLIDSVTGLFAFVLPMACFEAWRASSLGLRQYLQNTQEFLAFFTSRTNANLGNSAEGLSLGLFQRFATYSGAMHQHFSFSPLGLFAVLVGIAIFLHNTLEGENIRLLFGCLAGGALMNAVWWCFLSNGWPRYALIGLCLYFAAVSCVVFTRQPRKLIAVVTLLMVVNFSASYHRLLEPPRFVIANKFAYTPRVINLLRTVDFLKNLKQHRPFVSGWWGTAVDVEYSMPEVGNFIRSDHLDATRQRPDLILVRNEIWVKWIKDEQLALWEQRCNEVLLDAQPYVVMRCPANASSSEAVNHSR